MTKSFTNNGPGPGVVSIEGTAASGNILGYDGTDWVPAGAAAASNHAMLSSTHTDATGTAASGHILGFDGTNWRPAAAAAGGVTTLDGLTDTTLANETSGHSLNWNGTAWVNASYYLQPSGYQQPSGYIVPSGDYATVSQGHQLWQASGVGGADPTAENTWTADQTINDDVDWKFGTGGDVHVHYSGTDDFYIDTTPVTADVSTIFKVQNSITNKAGVVITDDPTYPESTPITGNHLAVLDQTGDGNIHVGGKTGGNIYFTYGDVANNRASIQYSNNDQLLFKTGYFLGQTDVMRLYATQIDLFQNTTVNGNFRIAVDDQELQFGTNIDAKIWYDGANLQINPKSVGTGILNVQGAISGVEGVYGSGLFYQNQDTDERYALSGSGGGADPTAENTWTADQTISGTKKILFGTDTNQQVEMFHDPVANSFITLLEGTASNTAWKIYGDVNSYDGVDLHEAMVEIGDTAGTHSNVGGYIGEAFAIVQEAGIAKMAIAGATGAELGFRHNKVTGDRGYIKYGTNNQLNLFTSNAQRMYINSSRVGLATDMELLLGGSSSKIWLAADNSTLFFGAAYDASIYYDGADLIVNPKAVGAGMLIVSSGTMTADSIGVGSGGDTPSFSLHVVSGNDVCFGVANAAPTDSLIGSGECAPYLDESGNTLSFRIRYSDGTLKTGTVALT